ncbi:MAG: hypothetical protein ACUVWR_15100 [Anaerolineae bacterium]
MINLRGLLIAGFTLSLLLAAAACAPQAANSTATKAVESSQSSGAAVIVYKRSGGLAGVKDDWTIYSDGRIVDGKGSEKRVSPEEVSEVLRQAEKVGFFTFQASGPRPNLCNDCFSYSLSITSGEKSNSLSLVDGQKGVPDEIWQLLQVVQDLTRA